MEGPAAPLDGTNAVTNLLSMNKDQSHGAAKNIKGRIKEAAGVLTGNKAEEAEGSADRATGAVQQAVGDLKHNIARKLEQDPPEDDGDEK
jgi:uncharacterized protein YjbJ (UPF0337 family)